MIISTFSDLSAAERAAILSRGGVATDPNVTQIVKDILADVRTRGEAAVLEYTARFDRADMPQLEASAQELAAVDETAMEYVFLRDACANIEVFHAAQRAWLDTEEPVETQPGITVWRRFLPIENVGIYAPGGTATYPSSVLMQAVPARLAGCSEITLATPPRADGTLDPVVIAAAKLAGVTRIVKAGGAQAIAALRYLYGADKLCGPGNVFVTEAKVQLQSEAAIDMPAGPSEVLVFADDTARPDWVAADLLSQAEHAPDASTILVTDSRQLAEAVAAEVTRQVAGLPRREIAEAAMRDRGQILVVDDLATGMKFANDYAPEHLEIVTADDERWVQQVVNAGSVFIGQYASEPAGDFATGSNHVLPTAGFAKNFGPLSVESFGKKVQFQKLTEDGLASIRQTCENFGQAEGLVAHARSVSIRFD